MTLSARIQIGIRAEQTNTRDLSTPRDLLNYSLAKTFTNGTGVGECNAMFHDTRVLPNGVGENLDLAGALTNGFGSTVNFAIVKAIFIYNKSTDRTVSVGGAATNQFINWVGNSSDLIVLRPGGFVLLVAPDDTGYPVTAATGDLLKITNSAGGSTDYDVIILGVSA